jgi:hypothetical protein
MNVLNLQQLKLLVLQLDGTAEDIQKDVASLHRKIYAAYDNGGIDLSEWRDLLKFMADIPGGYRLSQDSEDVGNR